MSSEGLANLPVWSLPVSARNEGGRRGEEIMCRKCFPPAATARNRFHEGCTSSLLVSAPLKYVVTRGYQTF